MFIYKITNNINGKVYIGQTTVSIAKRWKGHCKPCMVNRSSLSRSIQKYGKENFKIEEIDGANSQAELNYKEWLYVYKFNSLNRNKGYNIREGGGNTGRLSSNTKIKIGEKAKGRFVSEETKIKMSKSRIGKKPMLGKRHSEKTKEKISKSSKKQRHPIKCLENHKTYINAARAAEELGIKRQNIADFFYGKTKTAKGYTFTKV